MQDDDKFDSDKPEDGNPADNDDSSGGKSGPVRKIKLSCHELASYFENQARKIRESLLAKQTEIKVLKERETKIDSALHDIQINYDISIANLTETKRVISKAEQDLETLKEKSPGFVAMLFGRKTRIKNMTAAESLVATTLEAVQVAQSQGEEIHKSLLPLKAKKQNLSEEINIIDKVISNLDIEAKRFDKAAMTMRSLDQDTPSMTVDEALVKRATDSRVIKLQSMKASEQEKLSASEKANFPAPSKGRSR